MIKIHHCDCIEFMRHTPDGFYDLAIEDANVNPYEPGDRI